MKNKMARFTFVLAHVLLFTFLATNVREFCSSVFGESTLESQKVFYMVVLFGEVILFLYIYRRLFGDKKRNRHCYEQE